MSQKKGKGFFKRIFGTETIDEPIPPQAEGNREIAPGAETVTGPPEPADTEIIPETPETEIDTPPAHQPVTGNTQTLTAKSPSQTSEHSRPKGTQNWFARLQSGLAKTSSRISGGITGIFTKAKLDEDSIQDLEDILIQSDLGVQTSSRITDRISASRYDKDLTPDDIRDILSEEVASVLEPVATPLEINETARPHVILMVGVNGSGKTTTIGKLAAQYTAQGKKVMLVAGDTFRAAAVDQLSIWASRTKADFMSRDVGADAAGLAFDAIKAAQINNNDIVLIDTAGRLQNKATLMAELEKIIRVVKKVDETAPHSVILVLDATTGQNALNQVDVFLKQAGVTGLIMTKLDGTARGGILVAIAEKYALPIHAIGIGESIDDLHPFKPAEFADAIARI